MSHDENYPSFAYRSTVPVCLHSSRNQHLLNRINVAAVHRWHQPVCSDVTAHARGADTYHDVYFAESLRNRTWRFGFLPCGPERVCRRRQVLCWLQPASANCGSMRKMEGKTVIRSNIFVREAHQCIPDLCDIAAHATGVHRRGPGAVAIQTRDLKGASQTLDHLH
jgi:hypothetical protein